MSTLVKTIVLSLVSQTSLQNSTAPATSSSASSLASNADTTSVNTTTSAATNAGAACNAQSVDWTSASYAWADTSGYYDTFTTTSVYDNTTFSTKLYSCTSSCGTSIGAPSYCGPTTDVVSTTHVSTEFVTSTFTYPPFPTPKPNCTIASSDCSDLLTSYSSASSSYWSITSPSRSLVSSPASPQCSSCVATGCTFSHGGMDLYYFPVTANVSRDMCADGPTEGSATRTPDPDSTYTEVTTGLSTVVNGLTMWEGNVYLSLTEPFVQDSCGNTIEPQVKKPRVITMASSDLFSVRGYPHNVIPFSMNYADLNDPTPWSAYVGGWYCANNRPICSEVFPNEYYPVMSMPGQIRQLDPNWASCDFDQYGIFDPPIALHGVPNFLTSSSAVADPTQTSAEPVVSETASPGQTSNGGPSATSAPEPTSSPSDPEDPSSSTIPDDPASSNPSTPTDPQDPTASANPQDPTPSDPSTPTDPQDPTPSNTQLPSDPQESIPTDPQNPTPSDPQVTASGDPQNPAPTDPSNTAPSDPQNPTPSDPQTPPDDPQDPSGSQSQGPGNTQSPAPNDPQSPAPGNTQTPSPNDPQSPAPSNTQNPATNPNGNPTGTVGNSPSNPTPPAITVGPTVIPVDPTGGVIINPGTTLSSGGAPVVISSSTFNIGTGGLTIVSPETSTEIPFETDPVTVPVGPGSTPVILDPAGSTVVLGGTTLTQGGEPVTVGDNTLSVGSSGVVVVGPSGTSTIAIPTADSTTPQVVTVGSAQLTVTDGSVVLGPGTSLGVGDPAVTISDTVFSVGSTGLIVVGSGRTSTIPVTGLVSSSADATAADATRTGTETGSSATPSETGGADFPGTAGRNSWSTGSIIGVALGMIGVMIL